MGNELIERATATSTRQPICADHDEDCDTIPDKVHCWLYDPAKGRCPFLTEGTSHEQL